MDLESLKAALELAVKNAAAAPTDEALKTKAKEAQAAYDAAVAEADEDDDQEIDESKLDAKTKAQLKKLRDENAKARLKNKDLKSQYEKSEQQKKAILKAAGIEFEEEDPEAQIGSLTAQTQTLAFSNAVLEHAVENGVPKDCVKYFKFLISDAVAALEEGDELAEEEISRLAKEAKVRGAKKGNTTVGKGKEDDSEPGPGGNDEITLDKFLRMSILQKSALYETKPDVYKALRDEAKAGKKKLV